MSTTKQYETGWDYDADNETWRPPNVPGTSWHRHRLEDIPLIPAEQIISLPASKVTPGTFGAGDYVFPGQLTSVGTINGSWIELRSAAGFPAIDFTRTPGTADYNVRFANDADQRLSIHGGGLYVSGGAGVRNYFKDSERSAGAGLRVGAAWGLYGLYSEDGDLTLGSATGNIRFQSGRDHFDVNGITANNRAYMGVSGAHGGWAQFSHNGYWNSSGHYGMMHNGGSVLLSADEVILRYQNDNRLCAAGGDIWVNRPINMRGYQIWMKQYADDTHRIDYDAGFDGMVYSTWGDHRFYMTGGHRLTIFDRGTISMGANCGSSWNLGHVRAENNDGGSAGIAWHLPNHSAMIMENWRGDGGVHWRNNGGGWALVHADHDDLSMGSIKRNIRSLESVRGKVKTLQPKRFKMKRPDDPTAPLIVARAKETHLQWKEEVKEGRWDPRMVALQERQWEDDNIGFLAEDMAEVFPEVVTYDVDGTPQGIRYRHLATILWRMNQEQDEQIEDIERRLAVLERKAK